MRIEDEKQVRYSIRSVQIMANRIQQRSATGVLFRDILDGMGMLFEGDLRRPARFAVYGRDGLRQLRIDKAAFEKKRELAILKERKFLAIQTTATAYFVRLTDKGLLQAMRWKIEWAEPCPAGMKTMVLFDVPEQEARLRQLIRRQLRSFGFTRFQRSVWESEKDVANVLAAYFLLNGHTEWVRVIHALDPSA